MNKVILIGRLTRDPNVSYASNKDNTAIARFNLAVDRRIKNENQPSADFISCVAFGKSAEFAEKYLRQGTKIGLEGRIQTGSYTNKEGQKIYTTDVVVEQMEFAESKNSQSQSPAPSTASDSGFMNIPDGLDEELPFA